MISLDNLKKEIVWAEIAFPIPGRAGVSLGLVFIFAGVAMIRAAIRGKK